MRNKTTKSTPFDGLELKPTGLAKFDVLIEDTHTGEPISVYNQVSAQTKGEAINKVKQSLTFSAERSK